MDQQFIEIYAPKETRTVVLGGVASVGVVPPHVIEVVEMPARPSVIEIITAGGQGPPGPQGPAGVGDAEDIDMNQDPVAWFNLYAGI